jgi:phenol 2-monooxygenase
MDGFIQGQTDVLIVGAGPAGCMAASTLARYGIDFRLIDKRAARTQAGHASGKKTTTFVAAPSDF